MLVFGDSFTADKNNYVHLLRDSLPETAFINAAVPGIGIQEVNLFAANRIEQIKPNLIIYQVYVGNDLTDIKKPINWTTISFTRNLYWLISDYCYSLRFLNYKLGQIKSLLGQHVEQKEVKEITQFSKYNYSEREKLFVKANPNFINDAVQLKDKALANEYKKNLEQLITIATEKKIPMVVVVIPHCAQVNQFYQQNFISLQANLPDSLQMEQALYPFYKSIYKKAMESKKITCLNPLPIFQQTDCIHNRLYFENDIHLSAKGQAALGIMLYEYLKINSQSLMRP